MKNLKSFNLKGKKVLVRCDFNVPLSGTRILDDFRIKATLPTIEYLIEQEAGIILTSHLGRPQKIKEERLRIKNYSLKPIAKRLEKILNTRALAKGPRRNKVSSPKKVIFLNDCIGEAVQKEIVKIKSGQIILLENLRFYKEEEEGDLNFSKKLAELKDFYVNDAFGASHRSHASITGIPKFLPAAAGLLLEKEVKSLSKISDNPDKPLIVIIGGAKVETKTELINKMSEIADFILIGGLLAKEIKEKNIRLKHIEKIIEPINEKEGRDIGQKTINLFKEKIKLAKVIFWNGPFGKIEEKRFSKGTEEIAKAIVKSSAFSVVGGGETVEFVNKIGLGEKFNHLSTGGGAMLEFLSGEKLPGIEALKYGN